MRAILFLILLFSFSFVNAQKVKKIEPIEIKTLKLSRFPIADFPKKSIPISDIQVIQFLRDSVRLGYAMKGIDDHLVIMVAEKPPTYFLQQEIYRMYLNDFKTGGAQLLWVIKDLRIGEKNGFNQRAYFRVNADAYISSDLEIYKPVCSLDTVIMNDGMGDVTGCHADNIENALRMLLKGSLKNGKEVLEQNIAGISFEKIRENSKPKIDYPILQDEVYREGAYANFEEFLNNKPSINDFRVLSIGKKKEIKIIRISANNETDTVNIWGICKGGEIYKYYKGLLVSIEKQGSGFIISNYVEQATRRNNGMFVSAFLGGLAGGIVVGIAASAVTAAASDKPLVVTSIPYITKTKKQPEATCIDMTTGELSF